MIRLMLRWMKPMSGLRCLGAFGSLMPNRLNRRPRFTLTDQRQQVRFKACPVFCRMTKQELNESALPRAKMPVHSAAGKTVQNADRLLGKETFEFVGSHGVSLKFNTSNAGRGLRLPVHLFASRQFLQNSSAQDGNRLGCAVR
jgi:hypothetical protein